MPYTWTPGEGCLACGKETERPYCPKCWELPRHIRAQHTANRRVTISKTSPSMKLGGKGKSRNATDTEQELPVMPIFSDDRAGG